MTFRMPLPSSSCMASMSEEGQEEEEEARKAVFVRHVCVCGMDAARRTRRGRGRGRGRGRTSTLVTAAVAGVVIIAATLAPRTWAQQEDGSTCAPSRLDLECSETWTLLSGQEFAVHWTYDAAASPPLRLAMEARTAGWLSIGFPQFPDLMFGAHAVVGYVRDGAVSVGPYLLQSYSEASVVLDEDLMQISGAGGEQEETLGGRSDPTQPSTTTVVRFSLDELTSRIDPSAPVNVIFAFGDTDTLGYHGANKGSGNINLMARPPVAAPAPEPAPEPAQEPAQEPEAESAPDDDDDVEEDEEEDEGVILPPPPPPPVPEEELTVKGAKGQDATAGIAASRGLLTSMELTTEAGNTVIVSWKMVNGGASIAFGIEVDRVGGWVGLGFPSVPGQMVGAKAVIGAIDDDDESSVRAYSLDGYSSSDVKPLPGVSRRRHRHRRRDLRGDDDASPGFTISDTYAEAFESADGDEGTYIEFVVPRASVVGSGAADTDPSSSSSSSSSASDTVDIIYAIGPPGPGAGAGEFSYHDSRGAATINLDTGSFVALDVGGGTPQQRYNHGVLMWTAWGAVLPFGMGLGKMIRSTQSKLVLYAHILCQFSGLALATAGLVIACIDFPDFTDTAYHHGQLGVAVMALLYFQFLNGLVRPHKIEDHNAPSTWDRIRKAWELVHSFLGHATLGLAVVNCVLGIAILSDIFLEVDYSGWMAGFAATVVAVLAVVALIGRLQVQSSDREIALLNSALEIAGDTIPAPPMTLELGSRKGSRDFTGDDGDGQRGHEPATDEISPPVL